MTDTKIDILKQLEILQRALFREKESRKKSEKILEEKSRNLFLTSEQLKKANTQLENLLVDKTAQLQELYRNMVDAYLIMDLNGNILKLNDAAAELFEYNIEKEKVNVSKLIYDEDYEYAMQSFSKLKKEGYFKKYEARIITKSSKIKWVHINASILYDKQNRPAAAQGIIRDITSSRKQNELIQEQKDELEIIVDNSTFGIALIQQGKVMKSNLAFQELLGYTENELKNFSIDTISNPEDPKGAKRIYAEMASGKINKYTIEIEYTQRKGTSVSTRTTVNTVRHLNGRIKYQLIFVEDITKEKEKELIVQTINNAAKAVLGKTNTYEIAWEIINIIEGYLETNDCVIYKLNNETNSVEQIAAYGEKAQGKKIVGKLSIPIGEGVVGYVAKTGKAEIISDTSKDKRYIIDDNQRLSEITVPIISRGKVIGIIDSEHLNKNYFTPKHLETLSNIARIVSMQLDNAFSLDLKQKAEEKNILLLKELEKSNVELQEYAHVVSHDLKSPLRNINALTNWLKEDNYDKFDEESIKNFNLIESTLENMEQLISDILDYSSINCENLSEEIIDFNKIVNSIISGFQTPSLISIKVLNDLPSLKGDKIRFKQIFQNLIGNAVKYNDKEKGLVIISYSNNNTHHKFTIKDNGIGIEKKYFDRIFELYQSLHANKDSSGIGLSIVKKIVDFYKGDIWLESEIGIGTTFYFTLKK